MLSRSLIVLDFKTFSFLTKESELSRQLRLVSGNDFACKL